MSEAESLNDINLSEVRAKYESEKNRRIRADHNEQFIGIEGDFAHLADDPFVDEVIDREPLNDFTEVIIIGGGFGGLLAGAQLRKAGFEDIRMIEKGNDVGGTWYWNRYPGVQCDVESYIYLPLLEETNAMPSLKYAFGSEIYEHTQRLAKHFNLYDNICFQTMVQELRWNDTASEWTVITDKGDEMRARHICMANGPINLPKLPGIPGIQKFKGKMFHTSRWDYEYTGGDAGGDLVKLTDKKVAIIGTGATALQAVPHVGRHAQQLFVIQRTPTATDERNNIETDAEWAGSLEPGWQQERMDNFNNLVMGRPQAVDLVNDGWTDISRKMGRLVQNSAETEGRSIQEMVELADYESMQGIRDRCDEVVEDAEVAEALKPYYRKFCKRPGFHDEYLQTFNRDSVTLIDTHGHGVDEITETGFVVGGVEHEVDLIIFATGFEVGTPYTRRSGYDVVGRNGLRLSDKWRDKPATLYGIHTHDFPNLFVLGTVQGATGINLTQTLNEQAMYIAHILGQAKERGAQTVEPSIDAETAWGKTVEMSQARDRVDFFLACTPGYYNGEGSEDLQGGFWEHEYGGGSAQFYDILRDFRSYNALPGVLVDGEELPFSEADLAHTRTEASVRTRLQSEFQQFLAQRDMLGKVSMKDLPIEAMRGGMEMAASMRKPGPEVWRVTDQTIGEGDAQFSVRVYEESEQAENVVLYMHGGGFCIGSVNEFDAPMRKLCKQSGATVVSVDYRLAPEHPFPAAVDDALSAAQWAAANVAAGKNLYVAGDSAGGNLAAVVAQSVAGTDVNLSGQILIYPGLSGDKEADYLDAFESPILTKEDIAYFYDLYKGDGADSRFAPMNADLTPELPRTFIASAEYDLLRPEAEMYAEKLEQAGVKVDLREYKGAIHAFFSVGDGTKTAQKLMDDIVAFIKE